MTTYSPAPIADDAPLVPAEPGLRGGLARLWRSPRAVWCVALLPYLIAVAAAAKGITRRHDPHLGNLLDFLSAARAMRHGADLYASGTGGYVYPPLIAFLYQPLATLTDRAAGLVVLGVGAAVAVFTLAVISRLMVRRLLGSTDALLTARAAAIGAACTADKVKGEFSHLETNVLMLLAFTTALKWVDRKPWLSGLALGFAFNIKYLPVVLVPFLLVRGRWRAVGWFALWAVAFALLPAMSTGLAGDAHAWGEATGGLGRLFGVPPAAGSVAHVHQITDLVSISLTSGLARMTGVTATAALLMAAGLAAAVAAYAAVLYVRNRVPLVRWPTGAAGREPPFAGLFTIEWMGLLLLILALSPFTNSRHLYLLLDVNIAAAALLLGTAGWRGRLPLLLATVGLWLGVTFPPGGTRGFDRADTFWRTVGGPGWAMLGMAVALVRANARRGRRPAEVV